MTTIQAGVSPRWALVLVVVGLVAAGCAGPTFRMPSDGQAFQDRMLEDGVVTFDEYQSAHMAMLGCLDAAGVARTDPVYDEAFRTFRLEIQIGTEVDPSGAVNDAIYQDCHETYERRVAMAWASDEAYAKAFEAELNAEIAVCLSDRGVTASIPDLLQASLDEFASDALPSKDVSEYNACLDEAIESRLPR